MENIKPMSPKEIKEQLRLDSQYDSKSHPYNLPMRRLILAWAHQRAEAKKAEAWFAWIQIGKQGPSPSMFIDSYLDPILDDIGWPKDRDPDLGH